MHLNDCTHVVSDIFSLALLALDNLRKQFFQNCEIFLNCEKL